MAQCKTIKDGRDGWRTGDVVTQMQPLELDKVVKAYVGEKTYK